MRIALLANSNLWLEPFYDAFASNHDVWWGAFEEPVYRELSIRYKNVAYVPHEDFRISSAGNAFGYSISGAVEQALNDQIQPDIWITDVANRLSATRKTCMWVYAFHSFCYKRYVFHDSSLSYDLLLLPSRYFQDEFIRRLGFQDRDPRLAVTGFVKLDPLFGGRFDRGSVLDELGLDRRKKTVLYAPTWGGSSSEGKWGNSIWCRWPKRDGLEILELFIRSLHALSANVIIKLHHIAAVDCRDEAERICNRYGALWIKDSPLMISNPLPVIAAADVLVSDLSGMIAEFVAVNKPVVCIEPESPAAWIQPSIPRELLPSMPVTTVDELISRVTLALENPAHFDKQRRSFVADTLFSFRDNEAAARAKVAILRRFTELN